MKPEGRFTCYQAMTMTGMHYDALDQPNWEIDPNMDEPHMEKPKAVVRFMKTLLHAQQLKNSSLSW